MGREVTTGQPHSQKRKKSTNILICGPVGFLVFLNTAIQSLALAAFAPNKYRDLKPFLLPLLAHTLIPALEMLIIAAVATTIMLFCHIAPSSEAIAICIAGCFGAMLIVCSLVAQFKLRQKLCERAIKSFDQGANNQATYNKTISFLKDDLGEKGEISHNTAVPYIAAAPWFLNYEHVKWWQKPPLLPFGLLSSLINLAICAIKLVGHSICLVLSFLKFIVLGFVSGAACQGQLWQEACAEFKEKCGQFLHNIKQTLVNNLALPALDVITLIPGVSFDKIEEKVESLLKKIDRQESCCIGINIIPRRKENSGCCKKGGSKPPIEGACESDKAPDAGGDVQGPKAESLASSPPHEYCC